MQKVPQLVNHFALVGLSIKDLRTQLPTGSSQQVFNKVYTPKVLSHFPADGHCDHNAVGMLCFPDGLQLKRLVFPEEQKPEFHSFLITRENGSRVYGCALNFYEVISDQTLLGNIELQQTVSKPSLILSESEEDLQKTAGSVCMEKCICLTSQVPFVGVFKQYLTQLHSATIGGSKPPMPIENYLRNLLFEIPCPVPGSNIQFHAPLGTVTCKMPGVLDLPLYDYLLTPIVQKIGLRKLIKVLTCVLLERQLLIKSASYSELMECTECLTGLLCPFTWQHVYVPILPASQYGFLDAPVPYIMGLKVSDAEIDITNEGSLCMLDLSQGVLEVPEELPPFPDAENFLAKLQSIADTHNVECLHQIECLLSPTMSHGGGVINMLQSYFQGDGKSSSNDEISKLVEIATRAGMNSPSSMTKSTQDLAERASLYSSSDEENHEHFTMEVRKAFIQWFVDLFHEYEQFTIIPKQTYDQWKRDREQFQNFDRTAFLSDQPQSYLPFLSAFLDTQMFRTFIDEKIEAIYRFSASKSISLFDNRIEATVIEKSELMRSPIYNKRSSVIEIPCSPTVEFAPSTIEMPPPAAIVDQTSEQVVNLQPCGVFPTLDGGVLSKQRSSSPSVQESGGTMEKRRLRKSFGSRSLDTNTSSHMIKLHAKFVMQLWRESRVRVKNMVGSNPNAKGSVEENTQIANLCDLLERIWGHGLTKKEGKSPLWCHLMAFAEAKTAESPATSGDSSHGVDKKAKSSSPPKKEKLARTHTPTQNLKVQLKRKSLQSPELRERVSSILCPPAASLIDDIETVKIMSEIKTDVGRTRAWIRLALEKKMLYRHLVELLSNNVLCKERYKDYAFLRTEDEKEQFLLHMLTLSAKDFTCFSRGFKNSTMSYRVLVVGEGKRFGLSTACLYCNLAGEYASSGTNWFSKGEYTADIKCRNLGPIMCIRIGHDNSGLASSTWMDSVLVSNLTTGHTYLFSCHQWLSRTEGDGGTERFLAAKKLDYNPMASPPSVESVCCSVSGKRRSSKDPRDFSTLSEKELSKELVASVQSLLDTSASDNNYKTTSEFLNNLVGHEGFVFWLEQALLFGNNLSRKSKKQVYFWDLLVKNLAKITCVRADDKIAAEELQSIMTKLQGLSASIGKVERFQLFICFGLKSQLLPAWIKLLSSTQTLPEMYSSLSFLFEPGLRNTLQTELQKLCDITITLPPLLSESS